MENEPKKISFGFSKLMKKSNVVLNKEPIKTVENKVQLIDCLEEKSIKVVGGDELINKGPLVIPMKQPNKKLINLVDLVQNNFVETSEDTNGNVQNEANNTEIEINTSNLSLEEQATLELLNASKKIVKKEDDKRVIDIDKDKFVATGEKESTLDDYENVPIEEYGKAMLRGMGWKDGCGIGKNEKIVKVAQPAIRPKGMGLGADKITKQDPNNKPAVDRDGKVLKCVKRAYVKIIAGYHKGSYGQILGLDDESGRFIIRTAINNLNISLNEFLVVPVTKEEYNKSSKIINNAKYEEYMKKKQQQEEEEKGALKKEKSKKYESDEEDYKKQKSRVKKERKSDSSDAEEGTSNYRRSKTEKVKKEQYSDSDDDNDDDDTYKTKRKDDKYKRNDDDYEERRHKQKYYEETKSRDRDRDRDRKSKYDSDDEYKRDRKVREKKSKKYSSDATDSEDEDERKYKKSSKRDEVYSSSSSKKKSKKKKKSTKHSSDDSEDERHKRKSKKSDKKYYSDSENEEKRSKSHKRDKKDKSRYNR